VSIATDAPTTVRRLQASTASGVVAPASPDADQFEITLPVPQVLSLLPNRGLVGETITLTVNGRDFDGASEIRFEPPEGVAAGNPPAVTAQGTAATVEVVLAVDATLGMRVVRITTPGGTSSSTPTPANLFEVTDQAGLPVTPLVAPLVGVSVEVPEPDTLLVTPMVSPGVGVVVTVTPPVEEADFTPIVAPGVGIVLGPAVTGVAAAVFAPGQTDVTVTVFGFDLDEVDAVQVVPPDDITISAGPVVAPDGSSADVTLTVGPGASRSHRRVVLSRPAGVIPAVAPGVDMVFVGHAPTVVSIVPNQVAVGEAFELTINGTDLSDATHVHFLPSDDIIVGRPTVVDDSQLTVPVVLTGSTTPGARVVTVTTLAGTSSNVTGPNNTLTIVGSTARRAPPPLELKPADPVVVLARRNDEPNSGASERPDSPDDRPFDLELFLLNEALLRAVDGVLARCETSRSEERKTSATQNSRRRPSTARARDGDRRGHPRQTRELLARPLPVFPRPPTRGAC